MTYTSLNVHDILEKVLIVRQCLMVESKVLVRIVRLLKIRLTVSLTKRGISFFRTRRMAYLRSMLMVFLLLPEDIQFKALRSVVDLKR
jgi:hypothetical protein